MQDSTRTVCLKVIFVFDKLLSVALLYLLLPKQDVLHHLLICPSFTAHRSVLLTSVEGLAGTICLRANITKKVQILLHGAFQSMLLIMQKSLQLLELLRIISCVLSLCNFYFNCWFSRT